MSEVNLFVVNGFLDVVEFYIDKLAATGWGGFGGDLVGAHVVNKDNWGVRQLDNWELGE